MSANWYILYTKAGQEKKLAAHLSRKGFDAFCPLHTLAISSQDKRKIQGDPLFPRFVFVHITEEQILTVRNFPGVIQLIYWLSKPAIVKDAEINLIRNFSLLNSPIELKKSLVDTQEECQFVADPYLSPEKYSIIPRKTCLRVFLPSLGYTMTTFIAQEEVNHLPLFQKAGLLSA